MVYAMVYLTAYTKKRGVIFDTADRVLVTLLLGWLALPECQITHLWHLDQWYAPFVFYSVAQISLAEENFGESN